MGIGLQPDTYFLDIFEEHTQYFLVFWGAPTSLTVWRAWLRKRHSGGKHPQDYRFQARNIDGPHEKINEYYMAVPY